MTDRDGLEPLIIFRVGVQTSGGPFVAVAGVVDTGAQKSILSQSLVDHLNLMVSATGYIQVLLLPDSIERACLIYEANLMLETRDAGISTLNGFKIGLLPMGVEMIIGLDLLARFDYKISDGVLYLIKLKQKTEQREAPAIPRAGAVL